MTVPFSLPLIDQPVLDEVQDCLTNTGWLTSGPKVLALEAETRALTGAPAVLCVNSWTSGAMLMLRWYGIGPGDEVIIPAYTYSATALCALNIGAKVVMVDVRGDFTIDCQRISAAITSRTKAILPVDIGGWMADYDAISEAINAPEARAKFQPKTPEQEKLGRILVLADAAHSIGATYRGRNCGLCADATVLSFHSVKNVTTGEGGAICLNLPHPFDHAAEYKFLKAFALNGQTKSAFEKNQVGAWRYDIIAQGLKVNMPDICAAIGLAQIRRYRGELLPERARMFERYQAGFAKHDWAILPPLRDEMGGISSCHLYLLRIRGISEAQRDAIIQRISERGVGVNVHYIPMPMLTLFKNLGYRMEDYPNTYALYKGEISLPIYNGLSAQQIDYVIETVVQSVQEIC
jgi:dTDP-4-amino-4,6-dideoxygalactose transaminase